ncbi:MAG: NAD(P)H-dependent oxidoreductase subunit E [Pseudomonadota bacterium]
MEKAKIEKIVGKHRHEKAALLAILHEVQHEEREVSMESLKSISELIDVSFAHVYGLATFYSAFSTTKKGETVIRVCDGIACHLNGSEGIIEALKSHLNIDMGESSWDGKYSLEKVHCLGLCTIGPNIECNGKAYSRLDGERVTHILLEKGGAE